MAAALRYVALNPLRARLVRRAQDWPWSSAPAHLNAREDGVTLLRPVLNRFPRFADLLEGAELDALAAPLRRAETIGRPLGDETFMARLESALQRNLRARRRGPKPKGEE